ncbi:MAG: DUF1232 domain-containing protein [Ruminococcaceae bacterium]|nr:DUF1232 domain-containing protein [Oscillospiraceae bacterium]
MNRISDNDDPNPIIPEAEQHSDNQPQNAIAPEQSTVYCEDSLFHRIAHTAQKAGISIIYAVLIMYYTLQQPSTPLLAKLTILGALAYFISPVDFFPDLLPGGYADDVAIIIGSLLTVGIHVNDTSRKFAREKLHDWFGDYDADRLCEIDEKLDSKK